MEEVNHITSLCRIDMTTEEMEQFRNQLSDILQQFEVLQEVDTEMVKLTGQPVTIQSVMRDDQVEPSYPTEQVLLNAPRREEYYFRVRAVLE